MLKKQIISIAITLVALIEAAGQQDVSFSQYVFDKMLVNPAYAGSSKWLVGSIKNRSMISDIEGTPLTNIFSFQAPIQSKGLGLGLKLMQDKIAVTNTLAASGIVSYHIGLGKGKLSFGLEGGVTNNSYNYDDLVRIIGDDPAIPSGKQSVTMPDISAGVYYQNQIFYVGGAAYHLFNQKKSVPSYDQNEFYVMEQSYYGMGGLFIELSKNIVFEPGVLVKYVAGSPLQIDVNALVVFVNKLALGASYRTGDAIIGMIKIDILKNLKAVYSYDYLISELSSFSKGNHEISISYGIELLPPPAKKVIHPRYYF